MGVPVIALLGPMAVNGDSAVLSPRDRVVLAALAICPGEAISAERLADALWGEHPPASWHKVVPGCILRLRRVLGPEVIETTRYGYRLALPADEIDARRFERLLERGRELVAVGEPERAQYTLGEALSLWTGRALMDLDGWEPGRIEAGRLAELRMEAQECRLDAALRAGRHADVLAHAQSGVAEAPLRERRWALLALAQYRAGRQGEALGTLHRARTILTSELGLDPGSELVALEAAILRQDAQLEVPTALPDAVPACPYPGLICYDIADAETFFGRDSEVAECLGRLARSGVLAVVGPSGCGKSSLVRAGVGASLAAAGRRLVVLVPGAHPAVLLPHVPSPDAVLVVDQFEEVFTLCSDSAERTRFLTGLAALAAQVPVVISMRADRLGALAAHADVARLVERGLYLLGPMDEAGLRAAVTGPARRAGLLLEPGLVDLLVREVQGEPGALPLLSHALRQTWERREGRTLTVAGYQASGGIRGSIAQTAERLYESLTTAERPLLRQVLLRLVSAADDGDPVRVRVPRRLVQIDPDRERIVESLAAARLITTDRETVEIAHESLATAWPRLSSWLDDDVEGQRILRHLSASADAWQSMGRPESELYRGARLTHALDWQRTAQPDLTPTETQFLDVGSAVRDAERRAAEQWARHRTRSRRRTQLLVTGVAAMLVAAVVAGMLAVRQQRESEAADRAAAVAESRRIDDASATTPFVDQALLLAMEAVRVDDSPETRAVLTGLLSSHPALIRSVLTDEPVEAVAVSPDGATLVVGEGDSGTSRYSTEKLTREAFFRALPGWTIEFRADGSQLMFATKGASGLGDDSYQLSAAVTDPEISALDQLELSGVGGPWLYAEDAAYSADGRFLAIYAEGVDEDWNAYDFAVVVWAVDALDRPTGRVQPMPSYAVALSPDGRLLYVGTQEPALRVFDVSTGQPVRSIPLPASVTLLPVPDDVDSLWGALGDGLEISPDGSTLAVTEINDVVLYDSATLTELRRLRGHGGLVRSLEFSHDGTLLASGSADRTVMVWDVATGAAVHRLVGHAGAVPGLAFSPDDATLYTGGVDRRVLVWDLAGSRHLVSRLVAGAPRTTLAATAVPSPDGEAVMYAGSNAGRVEDLRFLDVPARRLGAPAPDRDGEAVAAWLPPDSGRAVTAADRDIRVWDRRTTEILQERTVAAGRITALAAGPEGRFVLVGEQTGAVQRIDADSLEPAGATVRLGHSVVAVASGPGDTGVALLDDGSYHVVDLADGRVISAGNVGVVPTAGAVSPDGARLVVGGTSGEIGLLELDSGEWIAPPAVGHRQYVKAVSFAPDGRTVVTTSFDGGVHTWDGLTGESIGAVHPAGEPSAAIATLLPDGHDAMVATLDGGVYRWDTRPQTWTAFACAVAGRNLSSQEWREAFGDQPYRQTCPAA